MKRWKVLIGFVFFLFFLLYFLFFKKKINFFDNAFQDILSGKEKIDSVLETYTGEAFLEYLANQPRISFNLYNSDDPYTLLGENEVVYSGGMKIIKHKVLFSWISFYYDELHVDRVFQIQQYQKFKKEKKIQCGNMNWFLACGPLTGWVFEYQIPEWNIALFDDITWYFNPIAYIYGFLEKDRASAFSFSGDILYAPTGRTNYYDTSIVVEHRTPDVSDYIYYLKAKDNEHWYDLLGRHDSVYAQKGIKKWIKNNLHKLLPGGEGISYPIGDSTIFIGRENCENFIKKQNVDSFDCFLIGRSANKYDEFFYSKSSETIVLYNKKSKQLFLEVYPIKGYPGDPRIKFSKIKLVK